MAKQRPTRRQLEVLDPALLVTLGRFSLQTFMPGDRISRVHGTEHAIDPETGLCMGMRFQGKDFTGAPGEMVQVFSDYRDVDGLPRQWIKRMMNSISSLAWRFSAHRMVADYVENAYLPAAGGMSCDMNIR